MKFIKTKKKQNYICRTKNKNIAYLFFFYFMYIYANEPELKNAEKLKCCCTSN